MTIALSGLDGSIPSSFMVALGTLASGDPSWKLGWESGGRWTPVLAGPASEEAVVDGLWNGLHVSADLPPGLEAGLPVGLHDLTRDDLGEALFAPNLEARHGADWLAFMGRRLLPVFVVEGRLQRTGCSGAWTGRSFRWPIWSGFCSDRVVQSLLAQPVVSGERERRAQGIVAYFVSSTRRRVFEAAPAGRGR